MPTPHAGSALQRQSRTCVSVGGNASAAFSPRSGRRPLAHGASRGNRTRKVFVSARLGGRRPARKPRGVRIRCSQPATRATSSGPRRKPWELDAKKYLPARLGGRRPARKPRGVRIRCSQPATRATSSGPWRKPWELDAKKFFQPALAGDVSFFLRRKHIVGRTQFPVSSRRQPLPLEN